MRRTVLYGSTDIQVLRMRLRMNDVPSYVPPFRVVEALDGPAAREVVASTVDGVAAGDTVVHWLGWREFALLDGPSVGKVDTAVAPLQAYLGVLGMTVLTAYATSSRSSASA